jgi:hypothetical protein
LDFSDIVNCGEQHQAGLYGDEKGGRQDEGFGLGAAAHNSQFAA